MILEAQRPAKLSLRQRWLRARYARDTDSILRLGSELIAREKSGRPAFEARRALARFHDSLNQDDLAAGYWFDLLRMDPGDLEAAYHSARSLVSDGAWLDEAIAGIASVGDARFEAVLRDALSQELPDVGAESSRHIAICGVSYCGSTLMDKILGSVAGSASIGESNWLVRARKDEGSHPIDFSQEPQPQFPFCTTCGPACTVLNWPFRRQLSMDRRHWYGRIGRQLGAETLISADKNPPKLVDYDPLLRFHALVLFKSPVQAWISHRDKLKGTEFDLAEECQAYAERWTRAYSDLLDHFNPQFGSTFLLFDDFTRDPEACFEKVCGALNLPVDLSVLTELKPGHSIGGNDRAVEQFRSLNYSVEIRPLPEPDVSRAEIEILDNYPGLSDLEARLRHRSISNPA